LMLTTGTAGSQVAIGIKRIVESGHRTSCASLRGELRKEHATTFAPTSALMTQHFRSHLVTTKNRVKRDFVA
jgi:hypothetical protein